MTGGLNLVSGFGALFGGWLVGRKGRRPALLLALLLQMVGSLLMAAAPEGNAAGYATVCAGRALDGLGIGIALMCGPLYTAEISPRALRGAMVTLTEIAINLGIVVGFAAGYGLADLPLAIGWRWMLGIGAAPPALVALALLWMPESPRWLVANGRTVEAKAALASVCGPAETARAIALMEEEASAERRASPWQALCGTGPASGPEDRARARRWQALLRAGVGVAFFQQASGIETAVYYSPQVFQKAGFNEDQSNLLTIGVGGVKLLFLTFALLVVDKRVGRRPMLLVSSLLMFAAWITIAVNAERGDTTEAAIVGQSLYMAAFSLGWGPVAWVICSEVFPLEIRGWSMGLATMVNRFTSGAVAMSFLSLSGADVGEANASDGLLGFSGTFYLYSALCAVSGLFAYLVVCVPPRRAPAAHPSAHPPQPRDQGQEPGGDRGHRGRRHAVGSADGG